MQTMDYELYHHGIKGQKWGVRRFQNPDGSLTEAGKKRYYQKAWYPDGSGLTPYGKKLIKPYRKEGSGYKNHEFLLSEYASEYGLTKSDDGKGHILSKDTPLYRVSLPGDKIDKRPKYVSYINGDNVEYEAFAINGQLWFDGMEGNKKGVASYKYRLKDDLKIATGRDVMNTILNKYGDKRMNKFYDISFNYDPYNQLKSKLMDAEIKGDEKAVQKYKKIIRIHDTASTELNGIMINNIMKTKISELSEDYIKKGYDAITDIEDALYSNSSSVHPLIILDPSKTLELDDKRWVSTPNVSGFDYKKHKKPE